MKLIVNTEDDRIMGGHMLGNSAVEIIQGVADRRQDICQRGHSPSSAEEFVTIG